MIHDPKECACKTQQHGLGFAPADTSTDWHWLLIAALAALVIFQAMDAPRRKGR